MTKGETVKEWETAGKPITVYKLIQLLAYYPAHYQVWFEASAEGHRVVSTAPARLIEDDTPYVVVLQDWEQPQ